MIIYKFNQFINEKVGVAIPSLKYSDLILNKIRESLTDFIKNKKPFSDEIIIKGDEISDIIGDIDEYKKFPVVSIELSLSFNVVKEIDKSSKFSVGGAASPFGHKNWKAYSRLSSPIIEDVEYGIIPKIDISIDITSDFENKDIDMLEDEINGTVWHEFNHLYEKYNRFLNIKGRVLDRALKVSLSYSDVNRWGIKKEIFKYWNKYFLYYIYISENYEINARVQELAYSVIKYGYDSIKNSDNYKYALYLRDFDSDEFIGKLISIISEYYDESESEYVMNRLMKMFISEYKKTLLVNKEKPTLNLSKIEKMSFEQFIEFFQMRFNKRGDRFFRKITKLSSLNEEV